MKHLWKAMLTVLLVALLLCACSGQEPTEPPEPPKPITYTVTYMVGDSLHSTQVVEAGNCPAPVTVEAEGLEVTGWTDGTAVADPQSVPVTGDVTYRAVLSPRLTLHMPFLQLDEFGFLRPEQPLTGGELEYALKALSVEAAWDYFPELPRGDSITGQQLKAVLGSFFPEEQVHQALTAGDTEGITRAAFAAAIHQLLGREDEEAFVLGASAVLPKDVTAQHENIPALLEACMRHTPDPEGQLWSDMELPTGWEPGYMVLDGWLYFVLEDGMLLRDSKQGMHYFGPDGRYTSGDAELDVLVADILKQIMEENPDLEGLDLLRKVYDHCHQEYKYLRKEAYGLGATGWEIEDAKEMFQTGRGNCYNFAAIFWALAKGLGYDVVPLAGTCTGTTQPHGWVGLYYEGTRYFVDPEWQYAYTEREVFDKDMFMLTMDRVWWWSYKWDKSQFPSTWEG